MPVYDDYMPEELEPETRELTTLLEYIYQQPAAVKRVEDVERARILVRARTRLINAEPVLPEEEQDLRPLLVPVDAHNNAIPADVVPPRVQPSKPRKGSRLSRTLNAIAAVLVVCGLIAGAVALFTYRASNVGSLAQSRPPVGNPAQPLSPVDSPTQFQSSSCFLNMDAGLAYICQHHLYQSFNGVQDIGGYRVALTRAYADHNRVVVSVEMIKLSSSAQLADLMLQDLTTADGTALLGTTGEGAPDGSGEEAVNIYTFPASLDKVSMLILHLKMEIVPKIAGKGGRIPANEIHTLAFDFLLPVHSEMRVIALNRTMTLAKGGTLLIKDLRISVSEAVFDAVYKPGNDNAYPSEAKLTVGTGHYTDDLAWNNLLGTNTLRFGYPLYNVHGTAELVVQNGGHDSPSYRFTIA